MPKYESEADRNNEKKFKAYMANRGKHLVKTKPLHEWDFNSYTRVDGSGDCLTGIVEFKKRTGDYPTIVLDVSKVDAMVKVGQDANIPAVYVMENPEGEYRAAVLRTDYRIERDYQIKRGEKRDVYHIPIGDFHIIQ